MPNRPCLIILLLNISCWIYATPANHGYDILGTREGLPHNNVLSIVADPSGFIWIGTNDGLCRYDGHEFKTFRNVFGEMGNAWGNAVDALACSDQFLFMGTRNGLLASMNLKTGDWKKIIMPLPDSRVNHSIKCILQTDPEHLAIGYLDGNVSIISLYTGVIRKCHFPGPKTIIRNIVRSGNRFFIISDLIQELDVENGKIKPVPGIPGVPLSISGNLLLHTSGNKLAITSLSNRQTRITSLPVHTVRDNMTYGNMHMNGFLLINGKEAVRLDTSGHIKSRFFINENALFTEWEEVNVLYEDKAGNYWLGTDFGLVKIIKDRYLFRVYSKNSRQYPISHNYVRSVYAESGRIWIGTKNGFANRIEESPLPGTRSYTFRSAIYPTTYTTINTFLRLKSGEMICGGMAGLYSLQGGSFRHFENLIKPGLPSPDEVWCLMQDKRGWVWVGTKQNGLFIFDPQMRKARHISGTAYPGLKDNSIWNFYEDKKGAIWIGTEKGLIKCLVRPDSGLYLMPWSRFSLNKPAGSAVWHIVPDRLDNLWIGTTDNGISYFDQQKRCFVHTALLDSLPLPSTAVSGLLLHRNQLWISTMNGLCVLDTRTFMLQCYTENDGLPANDFNFKACAVSSAGRLYFGTKQGVVCFDPVELSFVNNTTDRPLRITGVKIMEEPCVAADTIFLTHRKNNIAIRFALLDYVYPLRHVYRYRLSGFMNEWIYPDPKSPVAIFAQLPPGSYRFEAEAGTGRNTWSGYTSMMVVVVPAFWQTWWFRSACIALVLALIAAGIYLRMKAVISRAKEEYAVKQKIAELKLSALQAQMNPHFVFNALHSIQHFIITNDEKAANDYLTRFARLMRLFLESSKQKFITLASEIEILTLYTDLEKLRFGDKVSITVDAGKELRLLPALIPAMIIQPFVENAIMHGLWPKQGKGALVIAFSGTAENIRCVIDDDGIGREASMAGRQQKKQSRGIGLIEDRVNTYTDLPYAPICRIEIIDKKDGNGMPLGTTVIINFTPKIS